MLFIGYIHRQGSPEQRFLNRASRRSGAPFKFSKASPDNLVMCQDISLLFSQKSLNVESLLISSKTLNQSHFCKSVVYALLKLLAGYFSINLHNFTLVQINENSDSQLQNGQMQEDELQSQNSVILRLKMITESTGV